VLCALPGGAQRHRCPAGPHAGAASVRAVAIVGGMWAAWRAGAGSLRTLGEKTVMAARGVAHQQLPVDPVLAWLVQHIGRSEGPRARPPGRPHPTDNYLATARTLVAPAWAPAGYRCRYAPLGKAHSRAARSSSRNRGTWPRADSC
jgi:hypothetical protein